MTTLTQAQKECIAQIERLFLAVNEVNIDIPYNVLNINVLNVEVNRRKVAKSEFNIHNEGMTKVRYALRDKLCEKLNADFEAGNINLNAKEYGYDVRIAKKDCNYNSDLVQVHILEVCESHEFGRKIIGFEYSTERDGESSGIKCKTAEELLALSVMQKRIVWLIEKIR
jgi:hypothetical protein